MQNSGKRWFIAVMATLVQVFLGTVYAFSIFVEPISKTFNCNSSSAAWTFSIAIFVLGLTASWGGMNLGKIGARKMALTGAILYGLGYIVSYFALVNLNLPLLYLGYGVIGGLGLGLAYVTPVAVASKWFPDKAGMITGMVVMGFGIGAMLMAKLIGPILLEKFDGDLGKTFLWIGVILLALLPICANFMVMPPSELDSKADDKYKTAVVAGPERTAKQEIFSFNFISIWFMFSFAVVAGMIFLSFQSSLLSDLLKQANVNISEEDLNEKGHTLVAVSALFNAVGRMLWGTISDKLGKVNTFRLMLLIEVLVFGGLIFIKSPMVFSVGVCIVMLNYGGAFGVVPSLVKSSYGAKLMATMYGVALTAWGVGGILGPQITAYMKDHYGSEAGVHAFIVALVLLTIGIVLTFFVKNDKKTVKAVS